MNPTEDEQYRQFVKILEQSLKEKLDTLPLTLCYRFITHLLGLILEGKRDEAFRLLLAFVEDKYHPSLDEYE